MISILFQKNEGQKMGKRYVPKTYNNRRAIRMIIRTVISAALAAVILFLLLFFGLKNYETDGRLIIPWLINEQKSQED